jgi:hypothetical protein
MTPFRLIACALLVATLAGCSGKIASPAGQACSRELDIANRELEDAKVKGFGGSVQWLKAAGLLTEANTRYQLESFGPCLEKAKRARVYIEEAQK